MSDYSSRLKSEKSKVETRLLLDQLPFSKYNKPEENEIKRLHDMNRDLRIKLITSQIEAEEREMLLRFQLERQYKYTRGVESYVDCEIGKVKEDRMIYRRLLRKTASRIHNLEARKYDDEAKIRSLTQKVEDLEGQLLANQREVRKWMKKTRREYKEEVKEKMKVFLSDLHIAESDCYELANLLHSCELCSQKWR